VTIIFSASLNFRGVIKPLIYGAPIINMWNFILQISILIFEIFIMSPISYLLRKPLKNGGYFDHYFTTRRLSRVSYQTNSICNLLYIRIKPVACLGIQIYQQYVTFLLLILYCIVAIVIDICFISHRDFIIF
ncbi:hypothetical protein HZS_849, partial [Henneguya salminicola]